jgi:hypothetical protein
MNDFEHNITTLCKQLGVEFSGQKKIRKQNKNTVFNPALKKLACIEHTPTTAKINPFTLPFIR